jgi:phage-related protein
MSACSPRSNHGRSTSSLTTLDLLSFCPNMARAFGDGLFELRPRGRAGIGRAFYCFMVGKRVVVLHAFIKKTQQTPDRELKLARKRLKELQDG